MLRPRIPGVRPPPGPLPSYMGAPGKEPRLGEREELGQTHSMDPFLDGGGRNRGNGR